MLTKLPLSEYVPAVAAIPYRAAYTICDPPPPGGGPPTPPPGSPPGGSWQIVCTTVTVFVGWDYNPPPVFGGGPPPPIPSPIYTDIRTCRSVWVPG